MLNLSPEKLLLVGMIALVVLGPTRLPQAARTLGRLMAELRRMSSGVEREVRGVLAEPTEVFKSAVGEFHPADVRRTVRDAVSNTFMPVGPSASPSQVPGPAGSAAAPLVDDPGLPAAPDDPSLN
jgi:sec-independent protein translocase protein TatB